MAVSDYLGLITSEHNQRPKYMATIQATCQGASDNQFVLSQFAFLFDLDQAIGDQEDILGVWIGLLRSGLSDTVYRVLLKAKVALNNWDGTVPGMYKIWSTAFSGNVQGLVQDNQDMSMFVVFLEFFPGLDPASYTEVVTLLLEGNFDLRPAGVQWLGYYIPSSPTHPVFACDVETSVMAGPDVGYFIKPMTP